MIATLPSILTRKAILTGSTKAPLLNPGLVASSSSDAIRQLASSLHRHTDMPELLPFFQAILLREFRAPAFIGHGVALPHARVASLSQPWFALGTCASPIHWGGRSEQVVRVIFLAATPEGDSLGHLRLLAEIAKFVQDEANLNRLVEARTSSALLAAISEAKRESACLT